MCQVCLRSLFVQRERPHIPTQQLQANFQLNCLAKGPWRICKWSTVEFPSANNILSLYQSGFRKEQSTVSASLKAVNDITESLDHNKTGAALFVDLSKAFDTYHEGCSVLDCLRGCWLVWKWLLWKDRTCQIWCHFSPLHYILRKGSLKVQFWAHPWLLC